MRVTMLACIMLVGACTASRAPANITEEQKLALAVIDMCNSYSAAAPGLVIARQQGLIDDQTWTVVQQFNQDLERNCTRQAQVTTRSLLDDLQYRLAYLLLAKEGKVNEHQ